MTKETPPFVAGVLKTQLVRLLAGGMGVGMSVTCCVLMAGMFELAKTHKGSAGCQPSVKAGARLLEPSVRLVSALKPSGRRSSALSAGERPICPLAPSAGIR